MVIFCSELFLRHPALIIHHLSLLVLLAGGGKTDGSDRVSELHGRDADQSYVKLVGPAPEFSFSVTEELTCLES